MIKYIFIFIFILTSAAFAADNKMKYIEENCNNAYASIESLQQFFYKFEGNLPALKESKVKNLKFLKNYL